MKRRLRICLCLGLAGVLLLSVLSAGAAGLDWDDETTELPTVQESLDVKPSEDETLILPFAPGASKTAVLYTWAATNLTNDSRVFSSNLSDDLDVRQRWNESAVMYAQQSEQVTLHSFLNEAVTEAGGAYGLTPKEDFAGRTAVENLAVDLYTMAETTGLQAVGLSFVYAYKPESNALNPANSGLLRIYVSEDGKTWSEDYATVRRANILGSGTTQSGEPVIYYQVFSENLMNIDGLTAGDEIMMLRILPDGESGVAGGSFSLSSLSLIGYGSSADFAQDVPEEGGAMPDAEASRTQVLDAVKASAAATDLGKVLDGISLVSTVAPASVKDMLDTMGLRFADSVATKTAESIKEVFQWMYDSQLRTKEEGEQILAEYETITTTKKLLQDLNTPQQIFHAYAKCKPGDLLIQITDSASHVYMVAGVNAVYSSGNPKLNVDPNASSMTYVVNGVEKTKTFFKIYSEDYFAPMVADVLADNRVQPVRVDGHVSAADGVRVAMSSNFDMERVVLSMDGFTTTLTELGTSEIYTNADLDAFVAGLEPGKYEMKAQVYTGLRNQTPVTETLKFEVVGEEQPFALYNANMELGDSLTMYFYIRRSDIRQDQEYYATITKTYADGRADVVKTIAEVDWVPAIIDDNVPVYRIGFDGIAAKEMADDLKVQVFTTDNAPASALLTYSVRDYAMTMLEHFKTGELATLFVDMLNYGAQAQTFFGYNKQDLANAQLTQEQQALATQSVTPVSHRVVGPMYYNVSLQLESEILLQMYFEDVTSDMYAKVSFTDHYGVAKTMTVPFEQFHHVSGNKYYIDVVGLAVADGMQMVTCELYNASDVLVGYGTDSVESYIATMNNVAPDALYTQIMKFVDSAYRYFH